MNGLKRILLVEDDPKDVELTLTGLAEYNLANEVVVVRDGEEALTNTPASVLSAQGLEGHDRAGGGEKVTEPAKSKNDVPLETSIPGASLESVLCTEELQRRPSRPPDYGNENRALVALASALADSPRTILQTLAEKVLEIVQADSVGLSLVTKDERRFYWVAIAGVGLSMRGRDVLRW